MLADSSGVDNIVTSASLRSVRWQISRGTGGNFAAVWVAGFTWNRWQVSVEYALVLPRALFCLANYGTRSPKMRNRLRDYVG